MKHLLYILLLFCCGGHAWAQSTKKCFKAYDQQKQEVQVLCVGQAYEFQDCGDQVPDENEYYIFNYKNGSPFTDISDIQTHTFATPGTYRVLQIANYGSNTLTDTVSVVFEVKASPAPAFSVQSCANGTVSVQISDSNYSSYTIAFGDGATTKAAAGATVPHRYATAGTYTIHVSGAYAGAACTGESTASIITLPAAPAPALRSLTVLEQASNGQLQLELSNLQPGFGYLVQQWQNASYVTIDTLRNVTQAAMTVQVQNVNTTAGINYQVKPYDACATALPASNSLSSIVLQASSADEQVNLTWESMPFSGDFTIYRNGTLLQTLNSNSKQYTDMEVVCGQPYLYEVRATTANGSVSRSVTREVQVVSVAIPAAPTLYTTYNLNNEVELRAQLPQGEIGAQLTFERSASGGAYATLAQGQQATATDAAPASGKNCYRALYTNACGNTSPFSLVSCPMLLQAQKQPDGAAVTLKWSAYEGYPGGALAYSVELLDENGSTVTSYPAAGNTFTDGTLSNDLQRLRYRIKGTAPDGTSTYSNVVEVEQELLLYVPSGFTPNGDGLNDVFEVKGRFFSGYSIRIYNNLGVVVYQGTEADAGWDGTFKGNQVPAGAYAYEINAISQFGTTRRRTGTVTLLR